MKVDYHVHTFMCGHAEGTAQEYIEAAQAAGVEQMAFTDHAPLWYLPVSYAHQELLRPFENLERYADHVRMAQWWYAPFPVFLGLELDYVPEAVEDMRRTIDAVQADYILGSVHFIGGEMLYDSGVFGRRPAASVWEQYFALSADCAESGLVDSIAHMDVLKGTIPMPASVLPAFREAVRRIARAGVCVEVNTSGLRDIGGATSPEPALLRVCREEGTLLTLGSDAHHPAEVGAGMEVAAGLLRDIGYTECAVYEARSRRMVAL